MRRVSKQLVPLLLTLALSVGCDNDKSTNSQTDVIWPLAVGNEWQGLLIFYENGSVDSTEQIDYVIIEDTTIDNEKWYGMAIRTADGLGSESWSYLANRSDGLWQRSKTPRTEILSDPVLWLKYPARVGEKYMANAADSIQIISTSETVTTESGQYRCVFYQYDIDQGYNRSFAAPGVGIIRSVSNRFGSGSDPPEIGWELTKVVLK